MTTKSFSDRTDKPSETACQSGISEKSFASAIETLSVVLTEHASECRHCLEMVLFSEKSLADVGCDHYKRLLANADSVLLLFATSQSDAHVNEHNLQEYCSNLLTEDLNRSIEEHTKVCSFCANRLENCFSDAVRKRRALDQF